MQQRAEFGRHHGGAGFCACEGPPCLSYEHVVSVSSLFALQSSAEEAVELVGFLKDRRPDVRKAAGEAVLGLTGTPDGVKLLVEAGTVDTLCTMIGGEEVRVSCLAAALHWILWGGGWRRHCFARLWVEPPSFRAADVVYVCWWDTASPVCHREVGSSCRDQCVA